MKSFKWAIFLMAEVFVCPSVYSLTQLPAYYAETSFSFKNNTTPNGTSKAELTYNNNHYQFTTHSNIHVLFIHDKIDTTTLGTISNAHYQVASLNTRDNRKNSVTTYKFTKKNQTDISSLLLNVRLQLINHSHTLRAGYHYSIDIYNGKASLPSQYYLDKSTYSAQSKWGHIAVRRLYLQLDNATSIYSLAVKHQYIPVHMEQWKNKKMALHTDLLTYKPYTIKKNKTKKNKTKTHTTHL